MACILQVEASNYTALAELDLSSLDAVNQHNFNESPMRLTFPEDALGRKGRSKYTSCRIS